MSHVVNVTPCITVKEFLYEDWVSGDATLIVLGRLTILSFLLLDQLS